MSKPLTNIMTELDEDRRLFVKFQHLSARELMVYADALERAFEARELADTTLEKDGGLALDFEAADLWRKARALVRQKPSL